MTQIPESPEAGFGFAASSTAYFKGKYYALIIGINEYDDPMINDLVAPLKDANNLYGILSKSCTFNTDDILFLKNPKRAEIIDALDYLLSEQLFYSLKPAVLNNSDNVPQFGEVKNAGDEGGDFIFVRRE